MAIEASVWDLDGNCPYYKVFKIVSAPPKKVVKISEFKYPKAANPKHVYFLLLKLYTVSDKAVISRNFYWLHLPGKNYTLLEPYRKKQIPLKITCNAVMVGSRYELEVNVHNTSRANLAKNVVQEDEKRDLGLLQKLFSRCGNEGIGFRSCFLPSFLSSQCRDRETRYEDSTSTLLRQLFLTSSR